MAPQLIQLLSHMLATYSHSSLQSTKWLPNEWFSDQHWSQCKHHPLLAVDCSPSLGLVNKETYLPQPRYLCPWPWSNHFNEHLECPFPFLWKRRIFNVAIAYVVQPNNFRTVRVFDPIFLQSTWSFIQI